MKKIFYLASMLAFFSFSAVAQDEEAGKLQQKMTEYIQQRMGLSKAEADRFSPVFLDYFNDLKNTNKTYKGDRLVLQQKIVELRLKYRDLFKPIVGDKRSNDVFTYERDFIKEVKELRQDRIQSRKGNLPNKRLKHGLK